jgi:hypothetical protein
MSYGVVPLLITVVRTTMAVAPPGWPGSVVFRRVRGATVTVIADGHWYC